MQERRRAGARHFCIAGDLNMEWSSLCAVDEEDQELREMFGPNGGWVAQLTQALFRKKKMWCDIMKDFNCKASEIWSSFDDRWEWREYGRTTQLD